HTIPPLPQRYSGSATAAVQHTSRNPAFPGDDMTWLQRRKVKFCLLAGSVGLRLTGSLGVLRDPAVDVKAPVRGCTADELLPLAISKGEPRSSEWIDSFDPEPLYGCNCSFYKARYFCPSIDGLDRGYPRWVPHHIAARNCRGVSQSELAEAPFPPNSKVLMYGNSHMRQVSPT
ncbi:unnamed protein product, partial [Ectocarpus fasciculatus]